MAEAAAAPVVDGARVRETLRAFARIGYSADGGMRRLAFSRAELRARQLLLHLLERAGLAARVDPIGNIFGYLAGADNALPPVLAGSHLDTVPVGGLFDGAAGGVVALEAATTRCGQGIVLRWAVEGVVV